MQLLIPAAAGLEGVVKRQLLSLGYPKAPAENGRLALEGDWEDVARLNVFLQSGERVLIKLSEFPALTFDDLYDGVYALPWEEWLRVDSRILMDGKSVQSRLAAVKAAGGVAKKAIIRRLADRGKTGRRTFDESGPRTIVGLSLYRDRATVTLDTSGEGLHKRGYRDLAYAAPLKETLAAAIVDLSLWNPDAAPEKPFADVFCGSGTLAVEAAMKALHIAPGASAERGRRRKRAKKGNEKSTFRVRTFPPRRCPSRGAARGGRAWRTKSGFPSPTRGTSPPPSLTA